MAKRIPKTVEELNNQSDDLEVQERKVEILEMFINYIEGLTNPNLANWEKEWVYNSVISNSIFFEDINNDWINKTSILNNEYLVDYKFLYLYINCSYANDVLGLLPHFHLFFNKPIQDEENQQNVNFLEEIFNNWENVVSKREHKEYLLYRISVATEEMLNEEFSKSAVYGNNWKIIKKRQLLLFYKYLYLKGKKVFKHSDEYSFKISDSIIIYDCESYAHIGRHFGKTLVPDLLNKSFFSRDFLPENTFNILYDIFTKIDNSQFLKTYIFRDLNQFYFEFNKVVYSIWINLANDKSGKKVLKVSSLYPAKDANEVSKYSQLQRIKIDNSLYFFISPRRSHSSKEKLLT